MSRRMNSLILVFFVIIGLTVGISAKAEYTNKGWQDTNGAESPKGIDYGAMDYLHGWPLLHEHPRATPVYLQGSPTADFIYQAQDATKDSWAQGNVTMNWSGVISYKFNNTADLNNGLGFVVHINLPKIIFAGDVQYAIYTEKISPIISFKGTTGNKGEKSGTFKVDNEAFKAIGPHTLRFELSDATVDNVDSKLRSVSNLGGNTKIMSFSLTIPVNDLSNKGAKGTGPWNIITDNGRYTGNELNQTRFRFPPMKNGTDDFSVDFYDYDNILNQEPMGNHPPTGRGELYARFTDFKEGGNATKWSEFIPSHRVNSQTPLSSWQNYLSPWDSKQEYNRAQTNEVVDGSRYNLSKVNILDEFGLRNYTLDLDNVFYKNWGEINQENAHRFDRVVNFFSKKSVSGSEVNHSPVTLPQPGVPTDVKYSGSDPRGVPLSPVNVKVTDTYSPPELKIDNLITVGEYTKGKKLTDANKNSDIPIDLTWKASSMRTGKIVYRVLDSDLNVIIPETDFATIKNTKDTIDTYQMVSGKIAKLPLGMNIIQFKLIDDLYPTVSEYLETTLSGIVNVLDKPTFTFKNEIKNLRTGVITSKEIDSLGNDEHMESMTYTVEKSGKSVLTDTSLKLQLPSKMNYSEQSLSILLNGQEIDTSTITGKMITEGVIINLGDQTFSKGDNIQISYRYKPENLSNQTIWTNPVMLSGKFVTKAPNNQENISMFEQSTGKMAIVLPPEELRLLDVPSDFNIEKLYVPYIPVDTTIKIPDFSFKVLNTQLGENQLHWQITGSLTQPFHTQSGDKLPASTQLFYENEGKRVEVSEKNPGLIYSYQGNQRGEISSKIKGSLLLHLDPVKKNEKIKDNVPYQAEITWDLINGPTS
ncbi:hypothetical protein [Enterococcus faecalis]|uniref:hypothetical protein n=1 Tax=Enterococcus faecalis TaxID=1351 RepID=UPI002DB5A51B|nr:hypothetical protein [Enterococcus faecalis]MEB7792125.1 hypothetical protein [Enterococcus faecalis]MEB7810088.1 hypothetical protein [Enterococcus faecalis]